MAEDVSAYTSAAWVTKIVKRESGCRKLRYCGLRDIERPRYIGLRLATAKALEGFLPLMGRESSGTTKKHAPGLCPFPTFAFAGTDQFSLKLRPATHQREPQKTMRPR